MFYCHERQHQRTVCRVLGFLQHFLLITDKHSQIEKQFEPSKTVTSSIKPSSLRNNCRSDSCYSLPSPPAVTSLASSFSSITKVYYLSRRKKSLICENIAILSLFESHAILFTHYTSSLLSTQPHQDLQIICQGGKSTGYASLIVFLLLLLWKFTDWKWAPCVHPIPKNQSLFPQRGQRDWYCGFIRSLAKNSTNICWPVKPNFEDFIHFLWILDYVSN